jgi:hypothetical protein
LPLPLSQAVPLQGHILKSEVRECNGPEYNHNQTHKLLSDLTSDCDLHKRLSETESEATEICKKPYSSRSMKQEIEMPVEPFQTEFVFTEILAIIVISCSNLVNTDQVSTP